MYTDIPLLSRCCFCLPLRYGLVVWAYLKLVINIIFFGCGLIFLAVFKIFMFISEYDMHLLISVISGMVLILSDIIFCCVLIAGIHKKHTTLLRVYFRFGIVHASLFVIDLFMIITFLLSSASGIYWHAAIHLLAVFLSICCIFIILQSYLLLLIRSEILKLKANGQFQFVNQTSDPKCILQALTPAGGEEEEIL